MAVNTNIQVNNVLIQWPFLERVNETSNKFSFECVIPMDHPQAQEIINTCNNTWAQVSGGTNNPQSMGYVQYGAGDLSRIAQSLHPRIDQTKSHLIFKGVQNADTQYPIKVYDSKSQEIPNVGIVGEGTVANVGVVISGYDKPQRGVKMFGNWIQILTLEVNKYTGGHAPAPVEVQNGYVADEAALRAPMAAPVQQAAPMAAPVQQTAPMAAPVQQAAPMAPQGTPAPMQQMAPQGTPAPIGQGTPAPTIPGIPG